MPKFFVQVLLVKEIEVEAYDELQAERAAYARLGRDKHNAVGMKVFEYEGFLKAGTDDTAGALTDNNMTNMDYIRKHFQAIDVGWCSEGAL